MAQPLQAIFSGAYTTVSYFRGYLLGFIFLVSLSGCISFKIDPLPDPARVVKQVTLSRSMDESRELLEPGQNSSEFKAGVDTVYCFVHIEEVSQKFSLKWKWYTPENVLFKESQEAVINQEKTYLEAVTAYDRIMPESRTELFGQWSVAIFVDDVLLTRLIFTLVPNEGCILIAYGPNKFVQ